MKKLKIKIKKLKPYWDRAKAETTEYFKKILKIQSKIQEEFKDKDIEFFWVDGEIVGIGTPNNPKKMNLIHDTEFEK